MAWLSLVTSGFSIGMPPLGTRFTLTSAPRLPPTLVHWLPRYWYQAERPMASANAPWRKAEYTRNFLRVTSSVMARATLIFFLLYLGRSFIWFLDGRLWVR